MLEINGICEVWLEKDVVNEKSFSEQFEQRIKTLKVLHGEKRYKVFVH